MITHYKSRGAVYFIVELSRSSSSLYGSLPSMKNRAVTLIDHVTEKWFLFVLQIYYSFMRAGSLLGVNFKPPHTRNEERTILATTSLFLLFCRCWYIILTITCIKVSICGPVFLGKLYILQWFLIKLNERRYLCFISTHACLTYFICDILSTVFKSLYHE